MNQNTSNFDKKKAVLDKIKQYERIVITRHFRPDGDAIGSTKGLHRILSLSFPDKQVLLVNEDSSDYLAFLGGESEPISDEDYKDALVIVCDTATTDRISNKKYALGKEIIKIDHHIESEKTQYGDVVWVEEQRSSLCEMIVDFYVTFKNELTIDKTAATCLFTGMVTDTGRFRYSSVSGDTMRLAGELLDVGIDAEWIYANLNLDDFDVLKFEAYVYKKMKITQNGVAYIYVDKKMQRKFSLTNEQASNVVSYLDGIKGSIVWLAFIENANGTVRVRLRSRFMTINTLAEKYGGGGHDRACGATLSSKKQIRQMLADADQMTKEYKKNNSNWL